LTLLVGPRIDVVGVTHGYAEFCHAEVNLDDVIVSDGNPLANERCMVQVGTFAVRRKDSLTKRGLQQVIVGNRYRLANERRAVGITAAQ